MANVMSFPTRIVHGRGAIKELPSELKRAGATSVLLVTDKGILQAGLLRFVTPLLEQAGIKSALFADFAANPTDTDAIRGVEAYRAGGLPKRYVVAPLKLGRRWRRSRRSERPWPQPDQHHAQGDHRQHRTLHTLRPANAGPSPPRRQSSVEMY